MADLALEFAELCDRRDLAAYRVVSAVETVIRFWEATDFEEALTVLKRAHSEFEAADLRITEFTNKHLRHQPKGATHGNRATA